MPTPQGPMSQAEFAKLMRDKLRDKMPEIDSYSDIVVTNIGFEADPTLKTIVANPEYGEMTGANSAAYYKTLDKKRGEESLMQGLINTMPLVGSMTLGALGGAGTVGTGAIPGMAAGGFAGSELKDFLNKVLGMGDPNAKQKTGMESLQDASIYGALAGATPPGMQAIGKVTGLPKDALDTIATIIRLKRVTGGKLLDLLPQARATVKGAKSPTTVPVSPLAPRPGMRSWDTPSWESPPEQIPPGLRATGTSMESLPSVPPPPGFNAPAPRLPLSRPPMSSGTSMKVNPENIFTPPPPKVGSVVPEGGFTPEGTAFTEGEFAAPDPAQLGPATTRFNPETTPDLNMKAIESPEAITESKMQNTIDAIEAGATAEPPLPEPAPRPIKGEEDVLSHYAETPTTLTEPANVPGKVQTPLVRKGSTIILDSGAANPDRIRQLTNDGFKLTGPTTDGHLIFKK